MMDRNKRSIANIVLIGVFTALVFASSWIRINIPTPIDNTGIHLGNVLCLLSGFILGPLRGGMAAGLGSMLFDFTNPLYFPSWPFTLVFKFLMGFLCGLVGSRVRTPAPRDTAFKVAAAVTGQFAYIVLYLSWTYIKAVYWLLVDKDAAWVTIAVKAPVSLLNGVFAVALSVPLALALQKALKGVPLYRRFAKKQEE